MSQPWVLFEAGALSKTIEKARVIPLLVDIEPAELSGPFVQFQATTFSEADINKMLKSINSGLGDVCLSPNRLDKAFSKWWPDLKNTFEQARKEPEVVGLKKKEGRSDRELLEETLQLTRAISQSVENQRELLSQYRARRSAVGVPGSIDLSFDTLDLRNLEEQAVREALRRCRGNQTQAAKLLGITRQSLRRRMENLPE